MPWDMCKFQLQYDIIINCLNIKSSLIFQWHHVVLFHSRMPELEKFRVLLDCVKYTRYIIVSYLFDITVSPCDSVSCQNGGTCSVNDVGVAVCACRGDYSGSLCDGMKDLVWKYIRIRLWRYNYLIVWPRNKQKWEWIIISGIE